MNKTTEALKLAEEALAEVTIGAFTRDCLDYHKALAAIREALAEPVCEHHIADARNKYIKDGYICIKCGALFRAAFHAEPVKQEEAELPVEPVNQKAVGCYYGTADHIGHVVRIDVEIPIGTLLYAAPVRTKDLTDDEIEKITGYRKVGGTWPVAVLVGLSLVAAFKEKNK